ncbi:hypothetical protein [Streptomyces sp. NPDC047990]|uniref:hypothetical protein n=1 Tax=Streptomyces sp. NPDC047990 TaxID=3365496 RepID=UPI00371A31DC
MAVSLAKPYALEVATTGSGWADTTHAIRGNWTYFGGNLTKCGKRANSRLTRFSHVSRNHTLAITCKSCLK